MRKVCSLDEAVKLKASCKAAARVYYRGVSMFGKRHYKKNTPEWCRCECVRRRGDPKKTLSAEEVNDREAKKNTIFKCVDS